MIFYFTGTGNSLQIAKELADYQGESLVSIAECMNSKDEKFNFQLNREEKVGFVFPVYAWGPPQMVLDFIDQMKLEQYEENYTFCVMTCGENTGNTIGVLEKWLVKKNIKLNSGFSLSMPNNYILMGMDVDDSEIAGLKLHQAKKSIELINKRIKNREKGAFELEKGHFPVIMTALVNPMFRKHAADTRKFYANDNCTSCGICEKVCNTKTIHVNGKPEWGKECTQCLACINLCPVRAIEYGKKTSKRGRYHNPSITIRELELRVSGSDK